MNQRESEMESGKEFDLSQEKDPGLEYKHSLKTKSFNRRKSIRGKNLEKKTPVHVEAYMLAREHQLMADLEVSMQEERDRRQAQAKKFKV